MLSQRSLSVKVILFFTVILISLLLLFIGSAHAANSGDYTYTDNGDGTATITAYHGNDLEVVVPETLDGLTVIALGDTVFADRGLNKLVLNDSLVAVGYAAFAGNGEMALVVGADFEDWDGDLLSRTILTNVTIDANNPFYKDIDGKGFYSKDGLDLFFGTASGEIAEGTESLQFDAFGGYDLTEIHLPESLVALEDGSLYDNQLTHIEIGKNVSTIGYHVFTHNPLESITVSGQNPYFKDVDGLGLYTKNGEEIIQGTLSGVIVEGTEKIFYSAFSNLGLEMIQFPESLMYLGNHAFGDNQLTFIDLPASLRSYLDPTFIRNPIEYVTVRNPALPMNANYNNFGGNTALEIYGYEHSSAENFAQRIGVPFHLILEVEGVEEIAEIEVDQDTDISDVSLPSMVTALLVDGSKREVPVDWDTTHYNSNVPATYTLKGTLDASYGLEKPVEHFAEFPITVLAIEPPDNVDNDDEVDNNDGNNNEEDNNDNGENNDSDDNDDENNNNEENNDEENNIENNNKEENTTVTILNNDNPSNTANDKLPKTGSQTYNIILIGIIILGLGIVLIILRRLALRRKS